MNCETYPKTNFSPILNTFNQLNYQINSGQPTRGGVQEPNQNPYHPSQGGSFVAQ